MKFETGSDEVRSKQMIDVTISVKKNRSIESEDVKNEFTVYCVAYDNKRLVYSERPTLERWRTADAASVNAIER